MNLRDRRRYYFASVGRTRQAWGEEAQDSSPRTVDVLSEDYRPPRLQQARLQHSRPGRIRLLKYTPPECICPTSLSGGQGYQGPATYSLQTYAYGNRPYVALSYVWGDETSQGTILVNGRPFKVRRNLRLALERLSVSDPELFLWIDAICINQHDDREKSSLVQYMGEIFAGASKVYAWLGPVESTASGSSSDELLEQLSEIGALFWKHSGMTMVPGYVPELVSNRESTLEKCLPDLLPRFSKPPSQGGFPTDAYVALSSRDYWRRVWILQEVYRASDLSFICGDASLSSVRLAGAIMLLETFQQHLISRHASTSTEQTAQDKLLRNFALTTPPLPPMHRMMIYTSIYHRSVVSLRVAMTNFCIKELPLGPQATDPRDMIFGLLGFATPEERGYIKADYGASVRESYTTITRALIAHGFTDVLAWAQPDTKRIEGLPSWVPDFSATIYQNLCSQGQAKPWLPRFNASGSLPLKLGPPGYPRGDDDILSLIGRRIDTVARIGHVWSPHVRADHSELQTREIATVHAKSASYGELLTFLVEVQGLCKYAEEVAVSSRNNSARVAAAISCWRVPCADQILLESKLVRGDPSTASRYHEALEGLRSCISREATELPPETRPYIESLLRWVNRRPFVTASGFVGLGPADTREGDTVAVLDGFSACYVLREADCPLESAARIPLSNKKYRELYLKGTFKVIGEAYVDGLMDGQAMGLAHKSEELFHLI